MRFLTWPVLALLIVLGAGCDYPQAGFYALIGRDEAGKAVMRLPFAVEELVDDTEMTTGYVLLIPAPLKEGKPCVVEVPVQNGTDFTRRSWLCAVAQSDSRVCDLHVELAHIGEQLSFTGAYRPTGFSPVSGIAALLQPGTAPETSSFEFTSNLPALEGGADITSWELATLDQPAFEQAIGGEVAKAKRLAAAEVEQAFLDAALLAEQVPLESAETTGMDSPDSAKDNSSATKQPAKPKPAGKKKAPPNLGGRGAQRPH